MACRVAATGRPALAAAAPVAEGGPPYRVWAARRDARRAGRRSEAAPVDGVERWATASPALRLLRTRVSDRKARKPAELWDRPVALPRAAAAVRALLPEGAAERAHRASLAPREAAKAAAARKGSGRVWATQGRWAPAEPAWTCGGAGLRERLRRPMAAGSAAGGSAALLRRAVAHQPAAPALLRARAGRAFEAQAQLAARLLEQKDARGQSLALLPGPRSQLLQRRRGRPGAAHRRAHFRRSRRSRRLRRPLPHSGRSGAGFSPPRRRRSSWSAFSSRSRRAQATFPGSREMGSRVAAPARLCGFSS